MAEVNPMAAVGDTVTIPLLGSGGGVVAAQHGAGAHASGTTVLEITYNEVDWITPVRMRDPVGNTIIDSIVGANKAGWADVPAARKARLRCTVLTAGTIPVALVQQ